MLARRVCERSRGNGAIVPDLFRAKTAPRWAGILLAALVAASFNRPAIGQLAEALEEADSSRALTVSPAGLFDMHVRDIELSEVLRMLSRRAERNISVSQGVTGKVRIDLYSVTFSEALAALLRPAGFVWYEQDKFIHVCTADEKIAAQDATRQMQTRVFELSYISASEVVPVIEPLKSELGRISSTIPSVVEGVALTAAAFDAARERGLGGKSRATGEFIVVRDYPDRLEEIEHVINLLDARPRQVLIEAVILRVRLDESHALGIDFNALAGIDFRALGSASSGGLDLTTGQVPRGNFDNGLSAIGTDLTGAVPAGGVSFGVITNNVAMFIRALEETVDLTIIANPKVVTANEQLGRVIVGRQDGYLTTTVTQTAAIQTIDFIETGTQILFRPFIGRDGYIRLDIHPEDSSGGLTPDNLPFKDTTEVTASPLVRDGHTLVIGGLFRDVITSRNSQVPWLGNLPLIGALFRGKQDKFVREEVIVLITPHIIDGDDLSERADEALDAVERFRVGAHRGLMPWGRERLAQAHYRWALEHQRMERIDEALWDLDLALSLNPRFLEADRLREHISGRERSEADGSVIRDWLRNIARERVGTSKSKSKTDDSQWQ